MGCFNCGSCVGSLFPLQKDHATYGGKNKRCVSSWRALFKSGQLVVSCIDGGVIATYLPTCINTRV